MCNVNHMSDAIIATSRLDSLLQEVKACNQCEAHLPMGPRPVVRMASSAKLLIIGQAPGRRVHESGIPWNDPSGDRLRKWMAIDRDSFYNENHIAIMPMGFCYPGTGKSGDLPPRKECEQLWHASLLEQLPNIQLTLLIGQYAQKHYLNDKSLSLTQRVKQWRDCFPQYLPLPHPSPRNQLWLKKNPWFEQALIPELQQSIRQLFS